VLVFEPTTVRIVSFVRRSSLIRLLTFFAICIASEGRATTIPEIVAKAKPAVAQIITSDANWSPIKTGTGFFGSAEGTNQHGKQTKFSEALE
jgi:hypothetical protein